MCPHKTLQMKVNNVILGSSVRRLNAVTEAFDFPKASETLDAGFGLCYYPGLRGGGNSNRISMQTITLV